MAEDPQAATPRDPEPAAETPASPAPVSPVAPGTPTYHIAIWEQPVPLYVCLLCPADAPRFTLDDIKIHVPTVHFCDAVPTETIPMLIALRADADARIAINEALAAEKAAQAAAAQTPEETPHA
jgi:hypothetical protein